MEQIIVSCILDLLGEVIFNKKKYYRAKAVTSISLYSSDSLIQCRLLVDAHICFLTRLIKALAWEVCMKLFWLHLKMVFQNGPLGKTVGCWITNRDNRKMLHFLFELSSFPFLWKRENTNLEYTLHWMLVHLLFSLEGIRHCAFKRNFVIFCKRIF